MHKWNLPYRKDDVESGGNSGERPLYPTMLESPELRWGFIRKVYSIIAFQLLLTIAVAATVVTVRPIAVFFSTTSAGLALWIVLIITPLLGKALLTRSSFFLLSFEYVSETVFVSVTAVLCPLYYYHQKHPVNYLLLGIFTVALAFAVGLSCAFTSGKYILYLWHTLLFLFFSCLSRDSA